VWVSGSSGWGSQERPLLAHWNGHHWNQTPGQPATGSLTALTATSPENLWAAGGSILPTGNTRSLLEHFSCP
jgi:hypothetical protein